MNENRLALGLVAIGLSLIGGFLITIYVDSVANASWLGAGMGAIVGCVCAIAFVAIMSRAKAGGFDLQGEKLVLEGHAAWSYRVFAFAVLAFFAWSVFTTLGDLKAKSDLAYILAAGIAWSISKFYLERKSVVNP